MKYEREQTHICYLKNGNYDFEYLGSGDDKKFDNSVDWLAVKQQFFVSALIAKNKIQNAIVKWSIPADSLKIVAQTSASCKLSVNNGSKVEVPLQLYYGPSDYNVLSKSHNQMENIVPYGSGIFAFVKFINRHFLLTIFDFLRNNIASMGIVILLLTLAIRLITSPILYKSYLSGAKMKALKPEIDLLKAKFTDKNRKARPAGFWDGANEIVENSRRESFGRLFACFIADTNIYVFILFLSVKYFITRPKFLVG